jgi:hypothetical protein
MLASIYTMMRNLTLPWQKKRTTSEGRADVEWGAMMLEANLGRGHYSFELFGEAPPVYTDASKSQAYTGGGWVSGCGEYLCYKYGTNAKRKPIDALEEDTVLSAVESNGHKWRDTLKVVTIHIDNSSFQLSAKKGWSKADRLNILLKKVYFLCLKYECVITFAWISTHENVLADALSRKDGEEAFKRHTPPRGIDGGKWWDSAAQPGVFVDAQAGQRVR